MALIAPVLSQSTAMSGSAAVWLDALHIPLDGQPTSIGNSRDEVSAEGSEQINFPIHGRAEHHALDARVKEIWIRQLTAPIGYVSGT